MKLKRENMSPHRNTALNTNRLDRRTILRVAALAGGASALGATALSGCSSKKTSSQAAQANSSVVLPTQTRFEGLTPDIPGDGEWVADGFTAYPTTRIKATEKIPGDGSEVKAFLALSTPPPTVRDKNSQWQAMEDRLGVELSISMVPAGEMNDKFTTLVAGSDLPDIVQVWTTPTPKAALMSNIFEDITDLVSGDAISAYPNLANLPTSCWQYCIFDGAIHGVPIPRGGVSSTVVHQRQDILDSLGMEIEPQNVQELLDAAAEVTDEAGSRWAFTEAPMTLLRQMYGIANTWSVRNGSFTAAIEDDKMPDILADAKRFLDAGVVHPDSFSSNIGTLSKQWFNQGSAVFTMDTYTAMRGFYSENTGGDAFKVKLMKFGGIDGDPVTYLGHPTHSVVGLKKGDHERAAMLLGILDWLASPFGTDEYTMVNYGTEGSTFQMSGGAPSLTDLGKQEIGLGLSYLGAPPQVFYLEQHADVTEMECDHLRWLAPLGQVNPALALPSDTRDKKGQQLDKALADTQTAILQGKQEPGSWTDAVATWRKNGGDQIRKELEEAQASSKVTSS